MLKNHAEQLIHHLLCTTNMCLTKAQRVLAVQAVAQAIDLYSEAQRTHWERVLESNVAELVALRAEVERLKAGGK